MKLESLKNKALPSLAAFENKKITEGLKFILGGNTVTHTEGGTMYGQDGTVLFDYVADAFSGTSGIYGLCREHGSAEEFFTSASYQDWLSGL